MKAFRIQYLVIACALVLGGAAQAQPPMHRPDGPAMMAHGGMFGGHHLRHLLEKVDATEAQRGQIEAIFKAAHQDLAGQRDAGMKLHQQMLALYAAPNVDAIAIEALRQQISAQHEAASKRLSQATIDAARVLTPEQRAKIAAMLQKRQERMAAHRKPG